MGNKEISILCYADDVLMVANENDVGYRDASINSPKLLVEIEGTDLRG